jgi:hypothetical protein
VKYLIADFSGAFLTSGNRHYLIRNAPHSIRKVLIKNNTVIQSVSANIFIFVKDIKKLAIPLAHKHLI